jgi:hypothetical protein
MPTYVVGQVGDDDMAVWVAKGSIIGAKASLPKGGNTSALLRLATARCYMVPAISWRRVSTTNTVVAILAAVESCVWPATFLLLVDALSVKAGVPRDAFMAL